MPALLLFLFTSFVMSAQTGDLKVAPNHRFLTYADGKPFFYLGDTAWELFHRLNREEAEEYLENRRAKGFTVIQAVVLAELDGLNTPNANGDKPLIDNDPARPNEAYFKHVDWIVATANRKGLYIGMLPTWATKWCRRNGVSAPSSSLRRMREPGAVLSVRGTEMLQTSSGSSVVTAQQRDTRTSGARWRPGFRAPTKAGI